MQKREMIIDVKECNLRPEKQEEIHSENKKDTDMEKIYKKYEEVREKYINLLGKKIKVTGKTGIRKYRTGYKRITLCVLGKFFNCFKNKDYWLAIVLNNSGEIFLCIDGYGKVANWEVIG